MWREVDKMKLGQEGWKNDLSADEPHAVAEERGCET